VQKVSRELTVITRRRGLPNRLSVGLQIGFLHKTGRTLNSFQILPVVVLKHLGAQLRLAPPRLASIRALYRRQRTLFDHQRIAMKVLGFRHLTDHAERGLTAHLRRSAEATFSGEALTAVARVWLYGQNARNELRVCAARSRRRNSVGRTRGVGRRLALWGFHQGRSERGLIIAARRAWSG
jgi:Domain of unknown function (DUF4158)